MPIRSISCKEFLGTLDVAIILGKKLKELEDEIGFGALEIPV